ncbi:MULTISPECIES: amidohydrolase [unclassified Roseateles]|uniref:amidohydrolase family protein n=1 Tax=unclassified Roseateles TaxID=2626991 RepID=UPI0006F7C056|nr:MULTISPECIES: amidohydrolase family protein [unclassified Roseateles]KQW49765.1 amidohydrolase [Pelomonas sp. Root405]KRA76432.1 amidohydrolase [Pelomonas sp. Root662]
MKVDAHQHFWRLADRQGQWPPASLETIHRDFGPQDLEPHRQAVGIDATVLVQSLPSVADTHWMLAVAEATPWVRGVVGWVDFKAPDAADQIDALARHPLLKGLRPMLQDLPDDDWIADPACGPAAEAMQRHDLVFDALVLPRQLPALRRFAARHPRLRMVIDHAAKPLIARGTVEPWLGDLASLAVMPQVHCKLSGLLTEAGERCDAAALQPYVQTLWALFGPQRLLWGSDWPVLRLAAAHNDYADWWALAHQLAAQFHPPPDADDLRALFGANAVRLYRLESC